MSTFALVNLLKENNQDFEFYPTTKEMIESIYFDLAQKGRESKCYSVLDVGAGHGGFFEKFKQIRKEVKDHNISVGCNEDEDWHYKENHEEIFNKIKPKADLSGKFAIEKSEILINQFPTNVMLLGTDFWEQTLIDKQVDVIFSNPPYSQFEDWSAKVIREAHAAFIYLIIPQRWQNSQLYWQNDNTVKRNLFMEARFYKNGNVHLKINQNFMKAFNIEAARLNGWVRSAEDILNEFPDECKVSAEEVKKYYKTNFLISYNSPQNLLQLEER